MSEWSPDPQPDHPAFYEAVDIDPYPDYRRRYMLPWPPSTGAPTSLSAEAANAIPDGVSIPDTVGTVL